MFAPLGEHHDVYNSMLGMNGTLMMPHLNGVNAAASSAATAVAVQQVNGSAASTADANSEAQTVASHAAAATQPQQSSSGQSTLNSCNRVASKLFVGGLSSETCSKKLRQYFRQFGRVTNVQLLRHSITHASRGYGFITFSDPEAVEKVLKIPIHILDGKKIGVNYTTPKNRSKLTKVFVGGVSQDTSSEDIEGYFQKFGRVEETLMVIDPKTHKHRGFAFITFERKDVAEHVCGIQYHSIKYGRVECKKAHPKNIGYHRYAPYTAAATTSLAPTNPYQFK